MRKLLTCQFGYHNQKTRHTQKKTYNRIDYIKVTFQQELKKEKEIKGQLGILKQYKVKRAVKRNVIV